MTQFSAHIGFVCRYFCKPFKDAESFELSLFFLPFPSSATKASRCLQRIPLRLPASPYSASCSFHQAECWCVNMLVITANSSQLLLFVFDSEFDSSATSSVTIYHHHVFQPFVFIADVSCIVIVQPLLCLWYTLSTVNDIYNENVNSLLDHRAASLHIFKRMPESQGNVAFNCACFQMNLHPQHESKSLLQSSVLGFSLKQRSTA